MMKKKVRPVAIILSFVLLFVSMLSGCQKKEEKEELRQPILALALIKMEHNWGDFSNVVSRWELSEESKEQGPLIYVVPNGNYTFDRTLYYYKTDDDGIRHKLSGPYAPSTSMHIYRQEEDGKFHSYEIDGCTYVAHGSGVFAITFQVDERKFEYFTITIFLVIKEINER